MVLGQRLLEARKCKGCTRQLEWGCEKDSILPYQFDGETHFRCPLRGYYEDPEGMNQLMLAYWYYREGHFPEPGTWQDQSARLLRFFQVISLANQDADEALEEKRKREAARLARNPGRKH